jgi:hypothetical protein
VQLRETSQQVSLQESQKKHSEKIEREAKKDALAQEVLAVITTIWPSEDKRLADEDTFVLARNLYKNEFRGLTEGMIRYGIGRITSCQWPPTPFEFRKLCCPDVKDLGMNSLDETFGILQRRATDKGMHLSRPNAWIYQHIDVCLLMDGMRQSAAKRQVEFYHDMCKDRLIRKESLDLMQPKVLEHSKPEEQVTSQDVINAMAKLGMTQCVETYTNSMRKK